MTERETMVVAPQTLVVYAPFVQRLNVECSSSLYSQMECGWLLLMDACRTDVFRRHVPSGVCWSPHQLHWPKPVNHLSSASSTVSMTVLVVLSILSLPCVVDDLIDTVLSTSFRFDLNSLRTTCTHLEG
jgi:hypothetical protein